MAINNNFFIIESLDFADEMNMDWYEGKQLAEYLNKLSRCSAQYYYIRTKNELNEMAKLFERSAFTNLFVSCHGRDNALHTTLNDISFKEFASIFKEKLNNKRVFFSSCKVGTQNLANEIYKNNSTIFSIMAPNCRVTFKEIFPYWVTLFHFIEESINKACEKQRKYPDYKVNKNSLLYEAYKMCAVFGIDVNLWLKRNFKMQLQEIDQGVYDEEYD